MRWAGRVALRFSACFPGVPPVTGPLPAPPSPVLPPSSDPRVLATLILTDTWEPRAASWVGDSATRKAPLLLSPAGVLGGVCVTTSTSAFPTRSNACRRVACGRVTFVPESLIREQAPGPGLESRFGMNGPMMVPGPRAGLSAYLPPVQPGEEEESLTHAVASGHGARPFMRGG